MPIPGAPVRLGRLATGDATFQATLAVQVAFASCQFPGLIEGTAWVGHPGRGLSTQVLAAAVRTASLGGEAGIRAARIAAVSGLVFEFQRTMR